jgi:hypothetical protein
LLERANAEIKIRKDVAFLQKIVWILVGIGVFNVVANLVSIALKAIHP